LELIYHAETSAITAMIEVCCGQVKWKASQSYKVRCLMVSRSRQERGLMCFHVLVCIFGVRSSR
jgi:hypothetical protein